MMHHGIMSRDSAKFAHPVWVRQRELRQRMFLGHLDVFNKGMYSSMKPCFSWDGGENSRNMHGGIFSLEFSPNGSLLIAGREKSCFLMIDPLSRKLIHTVTNAHASLVTNIKFLDPCLFATGSVDSTISLWDARNLKSRIRILRGHSDAIQNIEFSPKNNLLISSADDGIICTWDIKNCAETEDCCRKIFRSYIPIHLRLSPDESKMIISTARGYLMVVHHLDFNTIAEFADELQMAMLGITSLREPTTPPARNASRCLLRRRRRNCVEVVRDFPSADDLNFISTLAIHPQGGSAISRCSCVEHYLQWICVHDIREKEPAAEGRAWPALAAGGKAVHLCRDRHESHGGSASSSFGSSTRSGDTFGTENVLSSTDESSGGEWEDWVALQVPPVFASSLMVDAWRGRLSTRVDNALARPALCVPTSSLGLASPQSNPSSSQSLAYFSAFATSSVSPSFTRLSSGDRLLNRNVHGHTPRMTHYFEEPNKSRFKNLCLSSDGRLICSLFDRGFRLLSFSPQVSEQSVSCSGREPIRLHKLKTYISHKNTVCSVRFSPRHCLLVSGCLGGEIAWYQPVV